MAKAVAKKGEIALREGNLLADLREMILGARVQVARAVDAGLVTLYWNMGRRIRQDILKEKRADYGERIVSAVGRELGMEFGRGFSEKSIRHMIRFAEAFPDKQIVSALQRQLTWSRFAGCWQIVQLDANPRIFRGHHTDLRSGPGGC